MWLLVLIITFLSALYLYNVFEKNKYRPPGPSGVPILGYLPFLNVAQPYLTLTDLADKYGPIYGLNLGSVYTVVLTDSQLIRDVLKRDEFTGRAPLFVTHGIMNGYGLICSEGSIWRNTRKLSIEWLRKMGMVKYGALRDKLETRILNGVLEAISDIKDESKRRFSIDPMHILHHTLGNVINDIVFGLKYEKDDKIWQYLQHLQEEGVKHIGISGVVNFLPFLRHLPTNKKTINFLLTGKSKTHKIYDKIIENRRKTLEKSDVQDSILSCFLNEKSVRESIDQPTDFLNDEQLRHLLADLFGAGVDTTLTTLRWFLLFVSMDDKVQSKIRDEMKSNLISPPALSDFDHLHYLRACISETQRIRSVVPLGLPHGSTVETEISGYKIPKNAMIIPLQWAIHMDPKIWLHPEVFNPNRFVNQDNGAYEAPPQFIPFQTGKRMCLGDELAKMLLFLYAARILYYYKLTLMDTNIDMAGTCGITLMPPKHEIIFEAKQV